MTPRESAGGIIIGPEGKIVLVCQHNNSWSLPKGKVEEGEFPLDAAKREIGEETGITDLELVKELGSYERYSIGPGGVGEIKEWGNQKKTFFLFTTKQTQVIPQDNEVTDARWVTIAEALELLTHPKDKEFLSAVRSAVEEVR